MSERPTFWFPVKRYGWGWGLPVRWEGWVVLVVYLTLLFGGIYNFRATPSALSLGTYLVILTAALVAIVVLKGEKPVRWRWGKK